MRSYTKASQVRSGFYLRIVPIWPISKNLNCIYRQSSPLWNALRHSENKGATLMSLCEQEGFIPILGEYRVWYRIVGGGAEHENVPLLTLHGGPGVPHDYITDMAELASATRRVIFYDQLGCGRSDQPNDPSLWTIKRSVEEIDIVRHALGLEQVHLWG